MPLPEWARSRPSILKGDEFYLEAFWELSSTRQFGFSPGPIPWQHVVAYASRAGLGEGMIAITVRVIRALDNAYLKWQSDQAERKRKRERKERE